jgi:hypothetical protein
VLTTITLALSLSLKAIMTWLRDRQQRLTPLTPGLKLAGNAGRQAIGLRLRELLTDASSRPYTEEVNQLLVSPATPHLPLSLSYRPGLNLSVSEPQGALWPLHCVGKALLRKWAGVVYPQTAISRTGLLPYQLNVL